MNAPRARPPQTAIGKDRKRASTTTADDATTNWSMVVVLRPNSGPASTPASAARIEPRLHASRDVKAGLIPRMDAKSARSTTARVMSPMRVRVMITHNAPTTTAVTARMISWSELTVPDPMRNTCGGTGPMPGTL